jgi:hypothetical protein
VRTPDGDLHSKDYWYYCQYHKYSEPPGNLYLKAWVGYKPTGKHYWESFYYVVE